MEKLKTLNDKPLDFQIERVVVDREFSLTFGQLLEDFKESRFCAMQGTLVWRVTNFLTDPDGPVGPSGVSAKYTPEQAMEFTDFVRRSLDDTV